MPAGEFTIGDSSAAISRSRAAYRRGDFAAVYAATQQTVAADTPPGELHLLRSRALLRERRFDEAEQLLAPHLGAFADADANATAAMLHGTAVGRRDSDEGLALLLRAERDAIQARAHPSIGVEVAYRRAHMHWMRGELADAERLACTTEVANVDVLAVRATQLRGFVALSRGRFSDALPLFERARRGYARCREHDVDLAMIVLQQIATLEQTLRCDVVPGTHRQRDGRTLPRAAIGLGGPSGLRVSVCGEDALLFAHDGDADRAYASARDAERFAPADAWRVRALSYRATVAAAFGERAAARSFAEDARELAARVRWNETSDDERFALLAIAEVLAPVDAGAAAAALATFDGITAPLAVNRLLRDGQDARLRGWTAYVRGSVARGSGCLAEATRLFGVALDAFRASGYRWREVQTLLELADAPPEATLEDGATSPIPVHASYLDQAVDLIAQHLPDSFLTRRVDGWTRVRLDPHGARLSPAQRDVLRHLLEGRSPREIAALKGRGYETIRSHVSALHRAFGTKSEHQLVAVCAARGIFPPRTGEAAPLREAAR